MTDGSIVIRARLQNYIVFGVIFAPMLALGIFLSITHGVHAPFVIGSFMIAMIFYYLSSLKLILADDSVTYKELWRTKSVSIRKINSIERGPKLFGYGNWEINPSDADPFVVKVSTFDPKALKLFIATLLQENAAIKIAHSLSMPK